jgi:hypothetical protein
MNLRTLTKRVSILVLSVTLGGLVSTLLTDVADARPGGGARGGGGAQRSGPASSGSVRGSHSNNRSHRTDNRRDNRRDAGDNRREGRHDVRDERKEFREGRVRRHRARHITRAVFSSLNCRSTVIIANGISYHSCGGTYYERVYQGGTVVYVIVTAPPGY